MNFTMKAIFVALLLWIVAAILIDHFIIQSFLPFLSSAATMKLQLKWPLGYFNLPYVGLFTLVGIPLLAAALRLLPWRPPRGKQNWINGFEQWSKIIVWFFVLILSTAAGQILYLLLKPIIPEGLRNVAESFQVIANVKFGTFEFAEMSGSLTAVVGLIFGSYIFVKKGIKQTLAESSGLQNYLKWK